MICHTDTHVLIQIYNLIIASSVYSAMMFTQPTNHSARFGTC